MGNCVSANSSASYASYASSAYSLSLDPRPAVMCLGPRLCGQSELSRAVGRALSVALPEYSVQSIRAVEEERRRELQRQLQVVVIEFLHESPRLSYDEVSVLLRGRFEEARKWFFAYEFGPPVCGLELLEALCSASPESKLLDFIVMPPFSFHDQTWFEFPEVDFSVQWVEMARNRRHRMFQLLEHRTKVVVCCVTCWEVTRGYLDDFAHGAWTRFIQNAHLVFVLTRRSDFEIGAKLFPEEFVKRFQVPPTGRAEEDVVPLIDYMQRVIVSAARSVQAFFFDPLDLSDPFATGMVVEHLGKILAGKTQGGQSRLVIPPRWTPATHHLFPKHTRRIVVTLLMIRNRLDMFRRCPVGVLVRILGWTFCHGQDLFATHEKIDAIEGEFEELGVVLSK